VNDVNAGKPFTTEKSNIFRKNILNSAWGSFSELPLIPKAQDAMTSVVHLYIVSTTSTGDPINSPFESSYCIIRYEIHVHSGDVIWFFVVFLKLYMSLSLTLIRLTYTFSFLIFPNFNLISIFNRKLHGNW
jgi:hypothetical protein